MAYSKISTLEGRFRKLRIRMQDTPDTFGRKPYQERKSCEFKNIRICGGLGLRGCLNDTEATFAPERVHSGSLSWLYICLHDTTTKCYACASHPGVSSSRFSYRGENFTPVRNLATISCKRKTTTRFGVKSVCRSETGTGSACVMFAILNHTCI